MMLLDLLQLPIQGYENQVWLFTSVASGLMALKGVVWFKSLIKMNGNGTSNGSKLLLSASEGEFRGTMKTLIANQLDLLHEMHEAQESAAKSQNSMSRMLDQHSTMLVEHDKREQKVWKEMLSAIEAFQKENMREFDEIKKVISR